MYPLSEASEPPQTVFVDAIDVVFDGTIPYDRRFFESLDRMIQLEPWLTRDKVMIDIVKSIGIEKGKPFEPDAALHATLDQAAGDAHAWLDAKFETLFSSAFYEGTQWALPASLDMIGEQQTFYADPDSYLVDDRGVTYSMAFFCPKHTGVGSFYLMAIKGKDGLPLDRAGTYRLTVPADAPVSQCWSTTIYNRAAHALYQEHATVERLPAVSRFAAQRRVRRRLLRAATPERRTIQLGPDRPRRRVRGAVPLLRPRERPVREGLAAPRHREADLAHGACARARTPNGYAGAAPNDTFTRRSPCLPMLGRRSGSVVPAPALVLGLVEAEAAARTARAAGTTQAS